MEQKEIMMKLATRAVEIERIIEEVRKDKKILVEVEGQDSKNYRIKCEEEQYWIGHTEMIEEMKEMLGISPKEFRTLRNELREKKFVETVEKGLSEIREDIFKKIGRNIDDDIEIINSFTYPKNVNLIANEDIRKMYKEKCIREIELFRKITGIEIGGLQLL